jgi:hypothetical protein
VAHIEHPQVDNESAEYYEDRIELFAATSALRSLLNEIFTPEGELRNPPAAAPAAVSEVLKKLYEQIYFFFILDFV